MNPLTRLHEWLCAHLYGDYGEGHPAKGYNSKIERWREYPYEPKAHAGHKRSKTAAEYGAFVVCYCNTCGEHYRQHKAKFADE